MNRGKAKANQVCSGTSQATVVDFSDHTLFSFDSVKPHAKQS